MVACIIAMVVCGILGLFSARYRSLAWEAFKCTFRLVTFRPCNTNFDQRLKAGITARLMKRSPKTAKFVFKNFTLLSIIFVILFFASLGYSAYSLYNLGVHGTCDINDPDSCPFAGTGQCNLSANKLILKETNVVSLKSDLDSENNIKLPHNLERD